MRNTRTKLAAVAVLAVGILLPVSYGTAKAIRKYLTVSVESVSVEYPDANGAPTEAVLRTVVVKGNEAGSEEQARARLEEFRELYLAGKAEEIEPGVWKATLSDGTEFSYSGPEPGRAGLEAQPTPEERERLKQQADEINELRKAGKGERTFLKEFENNGVRMRLYSVRYTLSNGEVVTVCEGEGISER